MSAPARINGSDLTERHSVIGGGSLTLPCPAAGVPPPHIRWTRDGKYLLYYAHKLDAQRINIKRRAWL